MTIFGGTLGGSNGPSGSAAGSPGGISGGAGGGAGTIGAPLLLYDSGAITFGGTSAVSTTSTTTLGSQAWRWDSAVHTCTEDGANGLQLTAAGNGYGFLTLDITDIEDSYSDNNFYLIQMQTTWTTMANRSFLMVGLGERSGATMLERYVGGHHYDGIAWRPGARAYTNVGGFANENYSLNNAVLPANARLSVLCSMDLGLMGGEMRDTGGAVNLDGTIQMSDIDVHVPSTQPQLRSNVTGTHFFIEVYGNGASKFDVHINRLEIWRVQLT